MILGFIIMCVLAIAFAYLKENFSDLKKKKKKRDKTYGRTNGKLEQMLVGYFIYIGCNQREAVRNAQLMLLHSRYLPCIPPFSYKCEYGESSDIADGWGRSQSPEKYESEIVKAGKERANNLWSMYHRGEKMDPRFEMDSVYTGLPKSEVALASCIGQNLRLYRRHLIGTWVEYRGSGMYQVIGYANCGNVYITKESPSGKIVRFRTGDKELTELKFRK